MRRNLVQLCRSDFDPVVRDRGQRYWEDGQVVKSVADGDHLRFVVLGTSGTYAVQLDFGGDGVAYRCDCPHFADGFNCKHLWAAILEADAAGLSPVNDEAFRPARTTQPWRGSSLPRHKSWQSVFDRVDQEPAIPAPDTRKTRLALYVLNTFESAYKGTLVIAIFAQDKRKDGSFGVPKEAHVRLADLPVFESPLDREILERLITASRASSESFYRYADLGGTRRISLTGSLAETLLPLLASTGRFFSASQDKQVDLSRPLSVSNDQPLPIRLRLQERGKGFQLTAELNAGETPVTAKQVSLITSDGWALVGDQLHRVGPPAALRWLTVMRERGAVDVPAREAAAFVERLLSRSDIPEVILPPALAWQEKVETPVPQARLQFRNEREVELRLWFRYGDTEIEAHGGPERICQPKQRRILPRDRVREAETLAKLRALPGARERQTGNDPHFLVPAKTFPSLVRTCLGWGWEVKAQGKELRLPTAFNASVVSGIDWFELRAHAAFGDQTIPLPELLQATRRSDTLIPLGDGTLGLLPEEWLARYAPLAGVAQVEKGALRFEKAQGILLDAWLAEAESTSSFPGLDAVRQSFARLRDPAPLDPPPTFQGKLRSYQRVGLGWLAELQAMGMGGVLADDMGLGKTIQCLAGLLRRKLGFTGAERPWLVVAPKSLIFNWREEAARFAPKLKVLEYTGTARKKQLERLSSFDLVLTNYPIVRLDIERLKEIPFDAVILDEAQSIKNADALTAKACRLLKGDFRLAMTGTPVENSVADLLSLFHFVMPGLLGSSARSGLVAQARAGKWNREALRPLASALRPFILRRTKEEVATDLPAKSEQILHVELEEAEMTAYRELRDYYRQRLRDSVQQSGLGRSKIIVLEALLRLRQLACHPGLLDQRRRAETGGKLGMLRQQLEEVTQSGHKALVFSQFTEFLKITQQQLAQAGLATEYLDGKTRDREERVRRFQEDPEVRVFLISLKAGGTGLNLTAADYVYLLDPWWNPAVEQQAIDRTHRIGQVKPVMAYRLITTGTVEEKVLELQKTKRELAAALLSPDTSLLQSLTLEDLEVLLA